MIAAAFHVSGRGGSAIELVGARTEFNTSVMNSTLPSKSSTSDYSTSPVSMIFSIWRNREITWLLAKRDVQARYKGSYIGLLWTLVNPLLMLLIYTFVFTFIFKSRWAGAVDGGRSQFALVMFVGVIIHGLFSEVVNRAPGLVLENPNYVTKVVFPLEILPAIGLGAALFHALAGILILLIGVLVYSGELHWQVILLPFVLFPFLVMVIGIAWILSALGVFARDLKQSTTFITTAMLFLSPVFYPETAWPEQYRTLFLLNPLTFIIGQSREVCLWGHYPDFIGLGVYLLIAMIVAWFGFFCFQKMRKGFADVL